MAPKRKTKKDLEREVASLTASVERTLNSFDLLKADRAEALRKKKQREKIIIALLMPWAAVLGHLKLRNLLGELIKDAGLGIDNETLTEVTILLAEHHQELLRGYVPTQENVLENPVHKLYFSFLHELREAFPELH